MASCRAHGKQCCRRPELIKGLLIIELPRFELPLLFSSMLDALLTVGYLAQSISLRQATKLVWERHDERPG
jgi:hypothetical protein